MTDFASIVRTADGTAEIEAAVGPSQYGHVALNEMVASWAAGGSTPRSRTIRRECARAALSITGENFAAIGRRIQCTRAAISAGVQEFCVAQGIPNRAGRTDDTRRRCAEARLRVHRREGSKIHQPPKADAMEAVLARLRGCCRNWLAKECGVSPQTARRWFMAAQIRRPIAFVETLAKAARRADEHPAKRGRKQEKLVARN